MVALSIWISERFVRTLFHGGASSMDKILIGFFDFQKQARMSLFGW